MPHPAGCSHTTAEQQNYLHAGSNRSRLPVKTLRTRGIQCCSKMREEKPEMQAYCVKCRGQQEIKDPKSITMANGRPAVQGTCPVCGTKLTRIVKKSE